jgi:thiamine biosynthesis lipoprotein
MFDPSGLIRGWAAERASAHLWAVNGLDFCLNAGGDIVLGGTADTGEWRIGLEDPDRPERLLTVVAAPGGAVATSSTTGTGAEIVDPYTGVPARGVVAATVTGPSLTWADVYATAAVARGRGAITWLDGVAGYQALVVDSGRGLVSTRGWAGRAVPATSR